ncbi:MAG TPA: DUF805 domain-containing protein [Salinarimonas sp.]|nr:DUF805 domain-containing protein [Salinarimonas sp.]
MDPRRPDRPTGEADAGARRGSAVDLFLGFEGRLDRERWLGAVALLLGLLLAAHLLTWQLAEAGRIGASGREAARVAVQAFLLVPWTALDWKRFHDLGQPGALALICPGLFAVSRLWDGIGPMDDEMVRTALSVAQGVVALWLALTLAYRAGTPAPNPYGVPPGPPQPGPRP